MCSDARGLIPWAVSFRVYDFDGDKQISKDELSKMLEASLVENHMTLSAEQIRAMVDATFRVSER